MHTHFAHSSLVKFSAVNSMLANGARMMADTKQSSLRKAVFSKTAFQLQAPTQRKNRWIAHVSSTTKLKATHMLVLNVSLSEKLSAFDVIERLLFAKTCDCIYSDEVLPIHQIKMLKQMAMFSGTELVFISDRLDFNLSQSNELEKA